MRYFIVLCFLVVISMAFLLGYGYNKIQHDTRFVESVSDGVYEVFDIIRAFNDQTGEPVYWIVGGKRADSVLDGKVYKASVFPSRISIYSIPRRWVENLPDDGGEDKTHHQWRLEVKLNKATLLK